MEPVFARASLHSKGEEEASPAVAFLALEREVDDALDDKVGVSKAKITVETLPSSGGRLVITGGSLGAEAHSPAAEAGTSLGEAPERILAAAAAP